MLSSQSDLLLLPFDSVTEAVSLARECSRPVSGTSVSPRVRGCQKNRGSPVARDALYTALYMAAAADAPYPPEGTLIRQWLLDSRRCSGGAAGAGDPGARAHGYSASRPHACSRGAIFGLGIFAAATLLTWASEVAETEVSAGLALVVLALIAVLPEYAVDLYFAIEAPHAIECVNLDPLLPPAARTRTRAIWRSRT